MFPILTKNFIAGDAIGPQRFVKFSASGTVVLVAVSDAATLGVTRKQISVLTGDRVDVQIDGIADCIAGGTIARGALLGVDAAGAVIAYVAGRAVGYALESAVAGDEVPVFLRQGAAA